MRSRARSGISPVVTTRGCGAGGGAHMSTHAVVGRHRPCIPTHGRDGAQYQSPAHATFRKDEPDAGHYPLRWTGCNFWRTGQRDGFASPLPSVEVQQHSQRIRSPTLFSRCGHNKRSACMIHEHLSGFRGRSSCRHVPHFPPNLHGLSAVLHSALNRPVPPNYSDITRH